MEGWLQQQTIPYHQFEPINANLSSSIKGKAMMQNGVAQTYVQMLYGANESHHGLMLILQDDMIQVSNLTFLQATLNKLPNNWNVV
jgi:hypothetical protein